MCVPPPVLALAGAAVTAASQVAGGMMANRQARYAAQIEDRNAAMAREAARDSRERGKGEMQDFWKEVGQVKGQQAASMAANGIDLGFGSAARVQEDTIAASRTDAERLSKNINERTRGFIIEGWNHNRQAEAARYKGKAELFGSVLSGVGSLMSGAAQYGKMTADRKAIG